MNQKLRGQIFGTLIILCSNFISVQGSAASFPVFDFSHSFVCSPEQSVGCNGLFQIHEQDASEMALLTNGEASFIERLRTLENAKKSIRIQTLAFKGDESGLKIAEILKRKKAEGLDVRIIVDGISNSEYQTQTLYFDLKDHEIEVEGFEAGYLQWVNEVSLSHYSHPNKRFHEKMWIIDGEDPSGLAIIGGMNIANEYFRIGLKPKNIWRDQDMIVRGSVVKDVVETFERDYQYFKQLKASNPFLFDTDYYWKSWNAGIKQCFGEVFCCLMDKEGNPTFQYCKDKTLSAMVEQVYQQALSKSSDLSFKPGKTRFFQNRPRFKETYIQQVYLDQIRAAKKEILIANSYFFPSDEVIQELRAAADRGVHVILLTNSKATNDVPFITAGTRYTYLDLMQSKAASAKGDLKVFEWEGHRFGEGTLHAKFAVFDQEVGIVGSYNLDVRSEKLNSETVMVFESPEQATELALQFLHFDLKKSREISLEEAKEFHNLKRIDHLIEYMISKKFKGQL